MRNICFNKATGEKNNSFVGLKIIDNQVFFYDPEAYQLSDFDDRRKDGDVERLWNVFECAVLDKDIENVMRQVLLGPDRQSQRKSALQRRPCHQRHEFGQAVISGDAPPRHQAAHEHAHRA